MPEYPVSYVNAIVHDAVVNARRPEGDGNIVDALSRHVKVRFVLFAQWDVWAAYSC
jgi:hypothetical protein